MSCPPAPCRENNELVMVCYEYDELESSDFDIYIATKYDYKQKELICS